MKSFPLSLFYFLPSAAIGLGAAHYLGRQISLLASALGLTLVLLLLLAVHLLNDALRNPSQPFRAEETLEQRLQTRRLRLLAGLAALVFAALLALTMNLLSLLNPLAAITLLLLSLLLLAWVLPPLRLEQRGLGEAALALVLTNLTPLWFFSLQSADLHRLLAAFVFPLTLQSLAGLMALSLPGLAADRAYQHQSFVLRFGWPLTLRTHNGLLLAAYFLLAAAPLWNIPSALVWPGLLSLPLAGLQLFLLRRVDEGQSPLWISLRLNTLAVFGVTVYLLLFALWTR